MKRLVNVGIVYIDIRGVGRRALLKRAAKGYIKAKLGKKDVVLGVDEHGKVADVSEPIPIQHQVGNVAPGSGKP